jgi:hypothetical protein
MSLSAKSYIATDNIQRFWLGGCDHGESSKTLLLKKLTAENTRKVIIMQAMEWVVGQSFC